MVGGLVEMSPHVSHWQSITQSDWSFLSCWLSTTWKQILILEKCPLVHPNIGVRPATGMNKAKSCVGLSRRTGAYFFGYLLETAKWNENKYHKCFLLCRTPASFQGRNVDRVDSLTLLGSSLYFLTMFRICLQASGASALDDQPDSVCSSEYVSHATASCFSSRWLERPTRMVTLTHKHKRTQNTVVRLVLWSAFYCTHFHIVGEEAIASYKINGMKCHY